MKTFTEYENEILDEVETILVDCGMLNGNLIAKDQLRLKKKTIFFRDFADKPEMANKTFVVYERVSQSISSFGDNQKTGGGEFVGVAVVTSESLRSEAIVTLCKNIENGFTEKGWMLHSRSIDSTDYQSNRKIVTYSISKVFHR